MVNEDSLHLMEAADLLAILPDSSIDLILTDPPYGIGYKASFRFTNGGDRRRAAISFGDDELQLDWIAIASQKLKPSGAVYVFTRWDVMHHTIMALEGAGLKMKQRIVWDKLHWTGGDLHYYGSQVEDILFAVKDRHHLNWTQREGNVWRLTKLDTINHEGNYDNPTQKPESLMRRIIERSSNPGELVVDPFMGTGTVPAAARILGRHYIGGDNSKAQFEIAEKRLSLPYTGIFLKNVVII